MSAVPQVGGGQAAAPTRAAAARAGSIRHLPRAVRRGGALFFALAPERAILSDTNDRLIRTYRGVRDRVEDVIARLAASPHDKEFFLRERARAVDDADDDELAAWFVYLNRTGYNGLYRVNQSNRFNVPFGSYASPNICDARTLRRCAAALRGADLRVDDFSSLVFRVQPGDFVYLDPPYVPLSATSSFTSYTSERFGLEDQIRLRDVALALKKQRVHVLISNSASPLARELYAAFRVEEVRARRAVNSRSDGRGPVTELLIS